MNLLETLVRRPALRHRNAVAYLTVRSWRASLRQQTLAAFKTQKREKAATMISAAAEDLADELRALVQPGAGWCVSCIACGHSRDRNCFGKCLARTVADALDLPFVDVFADRLVAGSSHPKEFRKLPPLRWRRDPPGPVLLIDDVATSGWHLEEALNMLRGRGFAAIGAAWIGGTLEDAEPAAALPAWCKALPGYLAKAEAGA